MFAQLGIGGILWLIFEVNKVGNYLQNRILVWLGCGRRKEAEALMNERSLPYWQSEVLVMLPSSYSKDQRVRNCVLCVWCAKLIVLVAVCVKMRESINGLLRIPAVNWRSCRVVVNLKVNELR